MAVFKSKLVDSVSRTVMEFDWSTFKVCKNDEQGTLYQTRGIVYWKWWILDFNAGYLQRVQSARETGHENAADKSVGGFALLGQLHSHAAGSGRGAEYRVCNFSFKMMDISFKTMEFAFKMTNFAFKMRWSLHLKWCISEGMHSGRRSTRTTIRLLRCDFMRLFTLLFFSLCLQFVPKLWVVLRPPLRRRKYGSAKAPSPGRRRKRRASGRFSFKMMISLY